MIRVVGAGIAGLESHCLSNKDFRRLNRHVLKKIRVMRLRDQYRRFGKDRDIPRPIKTITLWKWMNIIPMELELRTKRLGWHSRCS